MIKMYMMTAGGTVPATFQQAYAMRTSYRDLGSEAKKDLRQFLYGEQGGRCAYCERFIRDDSKTTIEHFHPQSVGASAGQSCVTRLNCRTLNHSDIEIHNLLLCCDGNRGGGHELTCDASKENEHICDVFYNPRTHSAGSLVSVESNGRVVASLFPADRAAAQRVIDNVLNLNEQFLVSNRRVLYVSLLKGFNGERKARKRPGGAFKNMQKLRDEFACRLRKSAQSKDYPSVWISVAEAVAKRGLSK